ncbi:hypothetical protein EDB81DRAFT_843147 [Dactylonectria macrodidyma]|uniref:C2H2-type domain-containing protein n=1 Tax=Dactylonectria macrodidyma TaxID=307937 RepID=A0A9P9EUB3_9HYPO|nr:hypothetical protein EDB81DRAFT_843147 [Dactylonectria macrodidyma]
MCVAISSTALQSHWTLAYCCFDFTCGETFTSWAEKEQHLNISTQHNICYSCPWNPGFSTQEQLADHLEQGHNWCNECELQFIRPSDLTEHDVSQHNMCDQCSTYYDSPSNLRIAGRSSDHIMTHAAKLVECPGCPRNFISDSAMVLHLETGFCPSGTDLGHINDIAFQRFQSKHYVCDVNSAYDCSCPTCRDEFWHISGLLQHAESEACGQTTEWNTPLGKFLHFLDIRVH